MKLIHGDCLEEMKKLGPESVQCVVTSPPYFQLRSYLPREHSDKAREIGTEQTPDKYVAKLVAVFREVKRALRRDGTVWLVLGDSMLPSKCEAMIPHRTAIALVNDGWICRQTLIWHKPAPLPLPTKDRCTRSHEYIFLLAKNKNYYYDAAAIAEPLTRPEEGNRRTPAVFGGRDKYTEAKKQSRLHSGNEYLGTTNGTRNKRSVWTVTTQPFKEAHFAVFPPALIAPCILAGSKTGDTVLDPFLGSGTTGLVALRYGREFIGIELNAEYIELARRRIAKVARQPCLF